MRPRDPVLIAAWLALAGSAARAADAPDRPAAAAPIMIDEIVAVVDEHAILGSDLKLEAWVLGAATEGASALAAVPDGRALSAALDRLIDQLVVKKEADRLQLPPVGAAEVNKAVRKLRATAGAKVYDQFLTDRQIDELSVREIVGRDLFVQRYLDGRFRQAARPPDAEVAAWFAAHKDEFLGSNLEDVKETIEARMTRERFVRLEAAFTADVRKRAQIRILHDPAAPLSELRMSGAATAAGVVRARPGD